MADRSGRAKADGVEPSLRPQPIVLEPGFQNYGWGDPVFIPRLFGLPETGMPYAEAWFGGHPACPSTANVAGQKVRLDRLVADDPAAILGPDVSARFSTFPFLLKVLAAARPLSVQAHPSRAQAVAGFRRENAAEVAFDAANRNYRDPNAKPELFVALTPFTALCGFRPIAEIAIGLRGLPELTTLLPDWQRAQDPLRALVGAYFKLADEQVRPALRRWVDRLANASPVAGTVEAWIVEADRVFAVEGNPDRGLFFYLLLNLITLEPGQGLFLSAGTPHAYLRGAGLEVMSNSDNVLRAGLTTKHIDTKELMSIVRFESGLPPVLRPTLRDGDEGTYLTPADTFELHTMEVDVEHSPRERMAQGPELLLFLAKKDRATLEIDSASRAVTLGSAGCCLVPHGSEYRMRATGPGRVMRVVVPSPESLAAFRGRPVQPLLFGTSGLRGLVTDITDLEAYVNTRGFLDYLLDVEDAPFGSPVAIAGDLRPSTDGPERSILAAVACAVADAGWQVVACGRIPTPALTAYGFAQGWPSIMVTGSHIPFDRNGIKFNKSDGEVLKSDEAAILRAVESARREQYHRAVEDSPFDDRGMFRSPAAPVSTTTTAARDHYVRRYLEFFPSNALKGMRIAVYEHSAVGTALLGEILLALGAEVFAFGRSATFVAIDTEDISDIRLREMQELADDARSRFGALHAMVSTDGDSDRPLLLEIARDGRVRFFPGDLVGILVADYLDADALAVPVTATDAIELHFAGRAIHLARTRVGSPFVIAAAERLEGWRRVGWEANGGFLTFSEIEQESRRLAPLPTRDAALPILAVLHAANRRHVQIGDLFARLPQRFTAAGLIDGIPTDESRVLATQTTPGDASIATAVFSREEVHCVEVSGIEHRASGLVARRLKRLRTWVEEHFGIEQGFGRVIQIGFLDGTRVWFDNGDVVHIRPSGNAPQLRVYALAASERRARAIVAMATAAGNGTLYAMLAEAPARRFVNAILSNIAATTGLLETGRPAALIGTVSGSASAQALWQRLLDAARSSFGARKAISFREDLPVNQAFGVLLLWQRLREHLEQGEGALVAFVFGQGTRATPFTEADNGQKPAMASFVRDSQGSQSRFIPVAELALRQFASAEAFLRRSGFNGIVVKWGDEIQIPTRDLSGNSALFAGADVVRFVSMQAMTADSAASKDWVGVDSRGRVTAFIPRRPLAKMQVLAARGVFERHGDALWAGINLGSVGFSRIFLDAMLEEFASEIADATADRERRPDLDPQLFTALTIAAIADPHRRRQALAEALDETEAMRVLEGNMPGIVPRLRAMLDRFETRHGRPARFVALDFGDQYWGDIGQHRSIFDYYMALNDRGPLGEIARALAGISDVRDADGNIFSGDTSIGRARVRNSVLIDCRIEDGEVNESVLIGSRAARIHSGGAFDVMSVVRDITLAERAGSYKVISSVPVVAAALERVSTVFLPSGPILMRVREDVDLRDLTATYDAPILGNPISFRDAHRIMLEVDPAETERSRSVRIAELLATWGVT